MIAQVEQIAISHGALKVQSVKLRIGPLSGMELPLLEHAYPFASAGTLAEGSILEIERAPLKVKCEACGLDSKVKPNLLTCRMCGSCKTRVVSGEELMLMSVELITT